MNERTKEILKVNYWPNFILANFMIAPEWIIILIKNGFAEDFSKILFSYIFFVLFFTILIGGIYHLWNEYWSDRRMKRLISKKRLLPLIKLGFEFDESFPGYDGVYKDYYISIWVKTSLYEGECLVLMCMVDVDESQMDVLERIEESGKYKICFSDSYDVFILDEMNFSFGIVPSFQKLKRKLDNLVFDLTKRGLKPVEIID